MRTRMLVFVYAIFFLAALSVDADLSSYDQWSVWGGWDGNDLEIFYAQRTGGQWSQPVRLNQDNAVEDSSPCVAVDAAGKAWVAWVRESEESGGIYCSRWDGMRWSGEELVGDPTEIRFSEPAIALDEEGQPWIVAAGVREGQDEIYYTHRTSTGTWSGWVQLNQEDSVPDLDPTLLAFEGRIWVVWSGYDGQGYQLFGKVWTDQNWGEEEKLFQGQISADGFPSLTIQEGRPSLIFYRDDKPFLSQWQGQNWSSPVPTVIPLEATFLDLWRNQGVSRTQFGWYGGQKERGSVTVLLSQDRASPASRRLSLRLKEFFKFSSGEAWAAVNPDIYTAFGDSITEAGYPPFLQGRITSKFGTGTVVNRGKGGERTDGGLSRINGVLNADNPGFILIMEGTNDIGNGRSPDTIAFNLEQMVNRSIGFGARPIISTITPRLNFGNTRVERTNNLIRGMAGAKGIGLADNYAAIAAQPNFESLYTDHIHFNSAGNDVIAQAWFDVINGLKGGGDGGGGCGSVQIGSPGPWNFNLEPFLFLIFVFWVYRCLIHGRSFFARHEP